MFGNFELLCGIDEVAGKLLRRWENTMIYYVKKDDRRVKGQLNI